MTNVKGLVLAAGAGSRMGALTRDRPKPMLELAGMPLLEHLLRLLALHDVTRVAVNVHHKPEAITGYFGDGRAFGIELTYSQEERLLGTLGAARKLAGFLDDTFFVLYGDVLTDIDLTAMLRDHREHGALATIALYAVEDPSRCGVVELGADRRVLSFVEKPTTRGDCPSNLANAGFYVLEPEILKWFPPDRPLDFGYDLFPRMLRDGGPVYGWPTDGSYVLDIGSPERYAQAAADVRDGRVDLPWLARPSR